MSLKSVTLQCVIKSIVYKHCGVTMPAVAYVNIVFMPLFSLVFNPIKNKNG